ncbi:L-ascorbate metabolism protein UlaG, beta-lactamase superfamily [Dyadobacter sp. SG02]|nr:L-ascorbate metabolism protein UlaG, beta-lactamase superfamily [Dyadobacter sp. SG02]
MLESGAMTLYIDPLQNVAAMAPFIGEPIFPVLPVPSSKTPGRAALITHVHQDHFDQPLLRELIRENGDIYGPPAVRAAGLENGLLINSVRLHETFTLGVFEITPVPAVDWIGDEQVSYIVSDGTDTIFHGGDTNWHGHWWPIARHYGPFDAAFLPVNGVVGGVPGVLPLAEMPGTMTPIQAVTATRILGSKMLVPMHYGQFDNPPMYTEFPDLENTLSKAGADQNVEIRRLADGEVLRF